VYFLKKISSIYDPISARDLRGLPPT